MKRRSAISLLLVLGIVISGFVVIHIKNGINVGKVKATGTYYTGGTSTRLLLYNCELVIT